MDGPLPALRSDEPRPPRPAGGRSRRPSTLPARRRSAPVRRGVRPAGHGLARRRLAPLLAPRRRLPVANRLGARRHLPDWWRTSTATRPTPPASRISNEIRATAVQHSPLTATVLGNSAAAVVGLGSMPAEAATDEVHVYQFVEAHHSGKDLAVLNASTRPGQPIVQFTRNPGRNQQWEITSLPSDAGARLGAGPPDQEPAQRPVPRHREQLAGRRSGDRAEPVQRQRPGAALDRAEAGGDLQPERWFPPLRQQELRVWPWTCAGGLDRPTTRRSSSTQARRHHQPAVPAGLRRRVARSDASRPCAGRRSVRGRPRSAVSAARPTP